MFMIDFLKNYLTYNFILRSVLSSKFLYNDYLSILTFPFYLKLIELIITYFPINHSKFHLFARKLYLYSSQHLLILSLILQNHFPYFLFIFRSLYDLRSNSINHAFAFVLHLINLYRFFKIELDFLLNSF